MHRIPRIAAVNDLSGFGRCSLAVAMPILSAMGFQVCPLPTVLLSAHTGYEQPYIRDFTQDMQAYLQHWDRMELEFEAIYTGFLGSAEQGEILTRFLQEPAHADVLRVVDPAMADHGELYASCTPSLVDAMRSLVGCATVTTPNLTEACLLVGEDYWRVLHLPCDERRAAVFHIGEQLLALGCEAVVITGVPDGEEHIGNYVLDSVRHERTCISTQRVAHSYAGTGDVFASVLCGALMRGNTPAEATDIAARFVHRATAYTAARDLPLQDGVEFEHFLGDLMGGINNEK